MRTLGLMLSAEALMARFDVLGRMAARLPVLGGLAVLAALSVRPLLATGTTVVQTEQVFVDTSRPTRKNGDFPGAAERTLRTVIWYPEGGNRAAPLPLLVLAHGWGGLPEKFDALATDIAAHGYVVAAPAFPLTNQHAPGGHQSGLGDLAEQPQDLAFVLSALIAAGASGQAPLGGLVDPSATAVLGHSLGGITVQTLAFSDCCGQVPIRAAILVSTPSTFDGNRIDTGPATLILHGTDDPLIPFDRAFGLLAALAPARHLVGIREGSHSALLESQVEPPIAARDVAERTIVAFLDAVLRDEPDTFQQLLRELFDAGQVVVRPGCSGDCDGDGSVAISELITGVAIALDAAPMTVCTAFDRDRSRSVTVDELLLGVRAALGQICEDR